MKSQHILWIHICDEERLYSNYNELPENSGDFYDGADMTKYEHNLLTIQIAKFKDHTVSTMVEKANLKSLLNSCNSSIIDIAICNKRVFTVNKHVIISNFSKLSPHTETSKDVWIIDSEASVHITNKLSDFTSYKPYTEPEEVETANKHDSLTILGEGTVFFETESDNGQIHIMRLDNICYIPNGSNRLLSRGQLCLSGLVEHADSESTTFLLLTGHIFLRGYPKHSTDTLHWVQSKITHPNVPMAEPSVFILNYETWHLRMAHPKDVLRHLQGNTKGFTPNLLFPTDSGICPGCLKGKMHNKSFPSSEKRASHPFQLIHADLMELPIKSYNKYKLL
jgi:hypothetical protein